MPSDLEAAFAHWWRIAGGPPLEAEYRFAPPRRFRFDFAHPASRVAIELDGGTFCGGRHVRGQGYRKDAEKGNAAAAAGWRVWHITADMLDDSPLDLCQSIIDVIGEAT